MITEDAVRKLALSFPEAVESSHFEVADFRVRKKIFATIHPGGRKGALLRLGADRTATLADSEPVTFQSAFGGSALIVQFSRIGKAHYAHLLEQAWRAIAPKKVLAAWEGRRKA
ncbi:MAG: MmcQ/YjbR family DNA-binding protein [Planctomycetota bacterium]